MEHITFEDLKEQGHIPLGFHREPETAPFQPYTSGPLPTPSGKVEFYSETLAAQGLDPLPGFVPAAESRLGEQAKRFPLEFLSRKADNYMNSTFANLDGHRKMEARTSQRLEMHPADAEARGIADGDAVRVWNDRGALTLTALVNGSVAGGRGGRDIGLGEAACRRRQRERADQRAADRHWARGPRFIPRWWKWRSAVKSGALERG